MPRLFRLLVWLVGLAVVMLLALVITISRLDANDYKDWLSTKVQQETGRTLTLAGDIDFSIFPWLGLEANGVNLGNAPGFGETPFLKMDHIRFRIMALPLLQGEYKVDTVDIKGAEINLARNAKGVTNWADLAQPATKAEEGEETKKTDGGAGLPLAAIALGGVAVENATLIWTDAVTGTRSGLRELNVKTAELKYGEPVDLDMSFHAFSNKPAIDTRLKLQGVFNYDTDNQQYSLAPLQVSADLRGKNIPGGKTKASLAGGILLDSGADTAMISDLQLQALGVKLDGALSITGVSTPAPGVSMQLQADGNDLAVIFKVLEVQPLARQIAKLRDRSFKVAAELVADTQRGDIDISKLQFALLGANIDGKIKARNIYDPRPVCSGHLTAKGPDLPTLMQVLGQLQGGEGSILSRYGKQFAGVRSKAFAVDADFDADIAGGDVKISTLAIDTLGVSIQGELSGENLQDRDGSLNGKLRLRAARPGLLDTLGQTDLVRVLQSVEFETNLSGTSTRVALSPLRVNAVLSGKGIPRRSARLALIASGTEMTLDRDLNPETLQLEGLKLTGMGINLSGKLQVKNITKGAEFDGKLNLGRMDLRRLASQLQRKLPNMADRQTLQDVAMSTDFKAKQGTFSLTDLRMRLDDTKLSGKVSAVQGADNTAYKFNLNIDELDLDRYLPRRASSAKRKATTPASGGDVIPVETLRQLDVAGNIKAGKLKLGKLRLADLALGIDAGQGAISLKPIKAQLYKGRHSGSVDIDATGKQSRLSISSRLEGIEMQPLLEDVQGTANIRGTGDLRLDLKASGLNSTAIRQTLNGSGNLSLEKGLFLGIDVKKVLEQVEMIIETKLLGGKLGPGKQTRFESLGGKIDIKEGVVSNHDLLMTGDGFKVSGAGMLADLKTERWDYDLKLAVTKRRIEKDEEAFNIGGYTIPVKCRGKIRELDCKPDITDIIAGYVKGKVQDIVQDIVQERLLKGVLKQGVLKQQEKEEDDDSDAQQKKIDSVRELLKDIIP